MLGIGVPLTVGRFDNVGHMTWITKCHDSSRLYFVTRVVFTHSTLKKRYAQYAFKK